MRFYMNLLKLSNLSANQVDLLNIGLMLISLVLAYLLPFEVFLFSYAVLGPLHYLTEISWLHQRKYFISTENKNKVLAFLVLTFVLILVLSYSQFMAFGEKILSDISANKQSLFYKCSEFISKTRLPKFKFESAKIFLFIFGLGAVMVLLKKNWQKFVAILFLCFISFFWKINNKCISCTSKIDGTTIEKCEFKNDAQFLNFLKTSCADRNGDNFLKSVDDIEERYTYHGPFMFFSVYLPTLIHVYFFTMLFMLYGALKSKSSTGKISVLVMLFCGVIVFLYDPSFIQYKISDYAKMSYDASFLELNKFLFSDFNLGDSSDNNIYNSQIGIMIGRFIAFAYTYHYLNWFSKTSIIQWHKMAGLNMAVVGIIWVVSIAIYLADYQLGLRVLIFLSFLHVCLEFPLNWQSLIGVFKEITNQKKLTTAA
jgi:hypothetical protein